jgi:hypothetical protein
MKQELSIIYRLHYYNYHLNNMTKNIELIIFVFMMFICIDVFMQDSITKYIINLFF